MTYYIGIDPGKTGGYAFYWPKSGEFQVYPFEAFSYKEFQQTLFVLNTDFQNMGCAIERVHAMPGQGVTSMFSFGQNYGGWLATLELLGVGYENPTPQTWQKVILGSVAKGEGKAKALEFVQRKFPSRKWLKKDHGVIDALCLARYAAWKEGEVR